MLGAIGDRVAVEFHPDEWYTGTITKVLPKRGYGVLFDDGENSTADPRVERVIKLDPKKAKKSKKSLTLKEMRLLKPERTPMDPATKTKTAKPERKARTPRSAKPERKTRGDKKVVKEPPKKAPPPMVNPRKPVAPPVDIKNANEQTAEEKHLTTKLSNRMFNHCKSPHSKLEYLKAVWTHTNKTFFDMKLPTCFIRLSKDTGTGFRRRGAWFPTKRAIAISPRLFNGSEAQILTTLVHEMCHQAVTDLDRISERTNQGHGPTWEKWMRHCGLTPSRYSKYDNDSFMTQDEKEKKELLTHRREKAKTEVVKAQMRPSNLQKYESAQWFDAKTNQWIKGIIACKHDQAGLRYAFTSDPNTSSFNMIPATWLYQLPENEKQLYHTVGWEEAAGRIIAFYNRKKERRADRRDARQRWSGLGF